jgi:hypothetical protein
VSKERGVSATPNRPSRARHRHLAAGAVALALVLSGCGHQKEPGSYSGAKDAFIAECTKQASADNQASDVVTKISSPKTFCTCVYDELSKDGGYPFSDFKATNKDLRESDGAKKLPAEFTKAYSACKPSEG